MERENLAGDAKGKGTSNEATAVVDASGPPFAAVASTIAARHATLRGELRSAMSRARRARFEGLT
jgi:hypothetical protein